MVFHAPHYYIISKILSHHGKDVEDLYKFQVNLFHEMAYTMHVGRYAYIFKHKHANTQNNELHSTAFLLKCFFF